MFMIFSFGKSAIGTKTIHTFMLFILLFIVFGVVYKQVIDLNYLDKIYDLFNTHQENIFKLSFNLTLFLSFVKYDNKVENYLFLL